MRKWITVSGPAGSGKDTLVNNLITEINMEQPGAVDKVDYYTTRKELRPGEDPGAKYFLTEAEFDEKLRRGELPFWDTNADYRVGIPMSGLEKNEPVIINMAPKYINQLRELVAQKGAEMFSIYLSAPQRQRAQRIRLREGWLFEEPVEDRLENDIAKEGSETEQVFDVKIENKEGGFDEVLKEVLPKVK